MSSANFYKASVQKSNLTRVLASDSNFDWSKLQSATLHGADLRKSTFRNCNLGGCDFKACRVLDGQLEDSVNWKGGTQLALRISDPHYCGHCGKQREVWGTKELAEKHHTKMHKDLPMKLVSISIEDGRKH